MINLHPDDEQALKTMLRQDQLPEHLVDLCERATYAAHRAGALGALGVKTLVGICLAANIEFPAKDKPAKTIWSDVPLGSAVEAYFFGSWQSGKLIDRAPNGALEVQLDEMGETRECYPRILRLPGHPAPEQPKPITPPQPVAAKREPVAVAAASAESAAEAGEFGSDPVEVLGQMVAEPIDWSSVQASEELWVDDGSGDIRDAAYVGVGKESKRKGVETVLVKFEGESDPKEVPASLVTRAA